MVVSYRLCAHRWHIQYVLCNVQIRTYRQEQKQQQYRIVRRLTVEWTLTLKEKGAKVSSPHPDRTYVGRQILHRDKISVYVDTHNTHADACLHEPLESGTYSGLKKLTGSPVPGRARIQTVASCPIIPRFRFDNFHQAAVVGLSTTHSGVRLQVRTATNGLLGRNPRRKPETKRNENVVVATYGRINNIWHEQIKTTIYTGRDSAPPVRLPTRTRKVSDQTTTNSQNAT